MVILVIPNELKATIEFPIIPQNAYNKGSYFDIHSTFKNNF